MLLVLASATLCAASVAGSASRLQLAATKHAACPRVGDAARLPRWPSGGTVHADIDGDRSADMVTIRVARSAQTNCAFLLRVETARRTYAARVPEPLNKRSGSAATWNIDQPFVGPVVALSPRAAEIVVEHWAGASVADVTLYRIVGGQLRALRFPERWRGADLELFGSVGTGDVEAGCARRSRLSLTSRGATDASGKVWRYSRNDYVLRGARFKRIGGRSELVAYADLAHADRAWRVPYPPFANCIVARGKRL